MVGFKVGTSTASMGYQWVNYPTLIGFQWNAPGESSKFISECANDTPWIVPESQSWSIVAPLMFHQYISVTAMDGTRDNFSLGNSLAPSVFMFKAMT